MPTDVTIYTASLWQIGAMVAGALAATWAVKKVIKLANRS